MELDTFAEQAPDINELLKLLVDKTKEFANCERVILYLYDDQDNVLFNRAGEGAELMEIMFKMGEGIPGLTLEKNKTLTINDVTTDPRYNPQLDDVSDVTIKNMLVTPITNPKKKKIGVMQLINKKTDPFNQQDVDFVESMSAQAAIAIDNTLLFNNLQKLRKRELELTEKIKEQNDKLQQAYLKVEEENKEVMETSLNLSRNRIIAVSAAILLFAAIGGYIWYSTSFGKKPSHDDLIKTDVSKMDLKNVDFKQEEAYHGPGKLSDDGNIYTVGVTDLNQPITLSGNLEPASISNVFTPFTGRILTKNFEIGEHVKKDQELLSLSTERIEVDYRNKEITEIKAREDFNKVKDWENSKELADARHQLVKAKDELQTMQKLFDLGIVSQDNLNNAKEALEIKEQALETEKQKGDATNVKIVQYKLDDALLNLKEAKSKLDQAIIRAEFDGVAMAPLVSTDNQSSSAPKRPLEPGVIIDEGTVFLSVADVTKLKVLGRVEEGDIAAIKQNQAVTITGDAFPGIVLQGKVVYISSNAKTGGRKPYFETRVETNELNENERKVIRIGMSATLSIITYSNPNAIMLPFGVVKIEKDGNYVYKLSQGKPEPEKIKISTGVTTANSIEVTSGLKPGDKLLVLNK